MDLAIVRIIRIADGKAGNSGSLMGVERGIHQFGGCNRLLGHYRTIGGGCLKFEMNSGFYAAQVERAAGEFQETVSFVPVEVLESFLEDLLNPEVPQDSLFIADKTPAFWFSLQRQLPFVALLAAAAAVLYAASWYGPLLMAVVVVLLLALGLAIYWHLSSRESARRMRFAQLLWHEIARRRGNLKDEAGFFGGKWNWRSWLGPGTPQSAPGT